VLVVDQLCVEGATDIGVDHGHGPIDVRSQSLADGHALELAFDTGQAIAKVINDDSALEVRSRLDHVD